MSARIVIVGAGHSAGQLAARLRAEGFDGSITLLGEEPHAPYQRPPLSKNFLAGEIPIDRVMLRPQKFYESSAIELKLGREVVHIDRSGHTVALSGGESVAYDKLVLATGSRARSLDVPGATLAGVGTLRRIADSEALRDSFAPGARLCVVGGGYIGLEVAAVAAAKGVEVTVLEAESRLLGRVVGPAVAEFYHGAHTQAGVRIVYGAKVSGFAGEERVREVVCADGARYPADRVLIAIGIVPVVALAERAGLEVADGIVVDAYGRTTDPCIYASGDCTLHPSRLYGRRVRLESVHNAMAQAKAVAANLCGKPTPYDEVPWFWSDQYDVKLQIAGLSYGYDQTVLRGDPREGAFSVFYLRDGVLIAADTINGMRDHLACRSLVGRAARLAPEELADPALPLKEL